jgi:hypothetical protein
MALIKSILTVLGFTGTTPPTGYGTVKEGRAQVTIGGETAQVPLVVNVDEDGNPVNPLTNIQLRASALQVLGPITDQQLRATALPVSLETLPGFATTPTVNLGTLGGAATETTLQQIRSAIQAQIAISSTLWTDNSGAYYVRKDNVNQATGVITVTFTDAQNNPATPGAGLKPVDSVDAEVVDTVYDATAAGTGYSIGDVLINVSIINTSATTPTATFMWINRTTQTTLSVAPPLANLIERKQAVSIAGTVPVTMTAAPAGAATDAAIATLNASINALTRHIAVQNILTVEMLDNGRTDLRSLLNDPTVTTY